MPLNMPPWYRKPEADDKLDQGDIIRGCPVAEVAAPENPEMWSKEILDKPRVVVRRSAVVVLSQACDLVPHKNTEPLNAILVASIYPFDALVDLDPLQQQPEIPGAKTPTGKNLNDIRRGRLVGWYPLPGDEGLHMRESAVDLLRLYTVSRGVLEYLISIGGRSIAINPPYREHLGAFLASVYTRFGLPSDD